MAEIIFLGTGAAWGLPEIGCPCPACKEALQSPKWQRTRTSILIRSELNLLIDPTTDLRQQLLREKISRIDAVIITHAHPDHFLGLDEFRAKQRGEPAFKKVPLFVGREAWQKRISLLFSYLLEGRDSPLELGQFLAPRMKFRIGNLLVETFPTRHIYPEKIGETFGFVFIIGNKKLIYIADFCEVIEGDDELLSEAELFITESSWLKEQGVEKEIEAGHISFERCYRQYLRRWRPKRVALVHISHSEGKTSRQWKAFIRNILKEGGDNLRIDLTFDGFKLRV